MEDAAAPGARDGPPRSSQEQAGIRRAAQVIFLNSPFLDLSRYLYFSLFLNNPLFLLQTGVEHDAEGSERASG